MNGMKLKFLDGITLPDSYYEQSDTYVNAPSCSINLLELSRYAKRVGKKLIELSQEEVKQFSL